ncbi:MAG: DUF5610 domain-containing protein [Candidatus Sedimenticola sp. (ex Thyasira tokunagai)]
MEIKNFGTQVHQLKSAYDKSSGSFGQEVSALAHEKNEVRKGGGEVTPEQSLDMQIIQSTLEVSFANGNESLALLLKTAIDQLNGMLEPELGITLQEAYESGLDVTPEATADRIVAQSTRFFSAYQERHSEMDLEKAVTEFTNLIKEGIEKGFEEARSVLSGLNVLDGEIAANIDKTYTLVQEKLQSFITGVTET